MAKRNRQSLTEMDEDGAQKLREAIVKSAMSDLINNYKKEETESFFLSDWGRFLTGVDPEDAILAGRLQRKYRKWRDAHKCTKCQIGHCRHSWAKGFDFNEVKGNKLKCLKEEKCKKEGSEQ